MSYLTVENFSSGVDRRRPIGAGVPGSLWEGINGHLTRGGDFEKRKEFSVKYTLPADATFGMASTEDALYVFGSAAAPAVPAGVTYQQLQHPNVSPVMTDILSTELFDGLLYVIAQYDNGDVIHFYNGVVVEDWINGIVTSFMVNNDGIATHLGALVAADATYTTTVLANVITIEAAVAGTAFTIDTLATNADGGTGPTAVVALVTPNVPGVAETVATCSFAITAGTNSAGVNKVTSIKVSGIEVLNVAVDWVTSNTVTAANVAAQINTFVSAPEYSATSSGDTVTISAAAGTGATANAFTVAIDPDGTVAVDGAVAGALVNKTMTGGVNAIAGQKQKDTVTIGGLFEVGDRFTIIIDDKFFGADGNPHPVGTIAHTQVDKVWVGAESIVDFSGVDDATGWNSSDSLSADAGAGSINVSTNSGGSSTVTGLETYQDKLAIFSRKAVQIWTVDQDENLNRIFQTIRNTGTSSPDSVIAFSDVDVIYLDRYGIRSLRARDASNSAQVAGIGALIDKYVVPYKRSLTDQQVADAVSAIDPEDGRLWMALGTKIFVFSYFPETKISGWSWYEPGFQAEQMVDFDDRMYVRSDDVIYLYGGDDNDSYDDENNVQGKVVCWIPFISSKKDGTYKRIESVDIAGENTWDMRILVDPNDLSRYCDIGAMPGFTYMLDDTGAMDQVTHFSPYLTCQQDGAATLSKVTVYFDGGEESGHG